MNVIFNLLIIYVLAADSSLDFQFIFSLREYFSSDVILLALKENEVEVAKQFYKYTNSFPKAFLGVIHLDKNANESVPSSQISTFQNMMIVSEYEEDFIKKLSELQIRLSHLMASLVLVIFEQEDLTAKLDKFYIPFNYKFLLIKKNYEILDVYQIGINDSKIYSHFSFWNGSQFETSIENFYTRRMDLRGYVINIMYATTQSYTQYWELFSERMNFTLNGVGSAYGGIYANGSKFGLFQVLEDHLMDGTHHNFKFSHDRAKYFDYIFPAYIAETKMYVALNQEINWASFIAPFSTGIWISILAWIFTASAVIFIITKYGPGKNPESFFFNVIKPFCSQSGIIINSSISYYIAYFMLYILGFVIVQAYSGVFLSFLTVKKLTPPFENLKGVIEANSHKILIENLSFLSFHFKIDQGQEATYIRNNLLVPENEYVEWENKKSGFEQVCRKKVVFITGTTDYTINEECDIAALDEILFLDVEGIIVWKGFPYKDIMNKLMKKIQLAGLMKLRRKNQIVPYESSSRFKPLAFNSVVNIFLILILFVIFSVLIFIFEVIFFKKF